MYMGTGTEMPGAETVSVTVLVAPAVTPVPVPVPPELPPLLFVMNAQPTREPVSVPSRRTIPKNAGKPDRRFRRPRQSGTINARVTTENPHDRIRLFTSPSFRADAVDAGWAVTVNEKSCPASKDTVPPPVEQE